MKKILKQLLAIVLAVSMVLGCVPVSAAGSSSISRTKTYIMTKDHLYWWYYLQDGGADEKPLPVSQGTLATKYATAVKKGFTTFTYPPNSGEVQGKVSTSNSKVLTAKNNYGNLNLSIKKAGTATVSYTIRDYDKNKKVKVKDTVKIYNYTNPVKSFKIGKKQLASKFKSSPFCSTSKGLKGKLSVTLNKGWKLISIRQAASGSAPRLMLNSLMGRKVSKLSNGKTVDIKKGAIQITVYNTKQKYYSCIILGQTPEGNRSDNVQ